MNSFTAYRLLAKHLGPGWLVFRAGYALRRKLGMLRRATPAVSWSAIPKPVLNLRSRTLCAVEYGDTTCVQEAEEVLRGEFRLFSHLKVTARFPPDWHADQLQAKGGPPADGGQRFEQPHQKVRFGNHRPGSEPQGARGLQHWTKLSDSRGTDIKGVWELNRFPWAFALVRAFDRTHDSRFAEAFWRLFHDWRQHNPPNAGPNWMCGQEATFRLMAAIFAAEVLSVPEDQREALARFVVTTGRRIAANIEYALSQKNNHGISECVGLITVALVAPEHCESAGWLSWGLRELEKQLAELVYEDGSFSQHSLIYHRLLLQDLTWCASRLRAGGHELPAWLASAANRALDFLITISEARTGRAPLFGSNDGANVLPLAEGDFLDLRPVIQMTAAVFRRELPLPAGPWDEAAHWLAGPLERLQRVPWPHSPARWHAAVGGYAQLTAAGGRVFMRCPTTFRHRPPQADMLHVDIWEAGRQIAHDGGSFSYNSTERFTALSQAAHHNVLTVGGEEPLRTFSRFLYLPWPTGEAGEALDGAFRASHDGYTKLGVRWMREIARGPGKGFVVRDLITGGAGHRLIWHWRLADDSWQLGGIENGCATCVAGSSYRISWSGVEKTTCRLLRADHGTAYGWWSPYYAFVEPATGLLIEVEGRERVEFTMQFAPTISDALG